MAKLRVHAFSLSLDGYGAAPHQDRDNPLGVGGRAVHNWVFGTRAFKKMIGAEGGSTGVDNDFLEEGFAGIGATIMGRNMFGPIRGDWPDETWKGWWGDNPPYHTPVFVLTHHPRAPIEMQGGTVFHFVTGGIREAYDMAMAAANGQDVRLGGGVNTVRQYLNARLVDEMHIAVSPVLLGAGESLFAGLDIAALGYACTEFVGTANAAHYRVVRR